MKTHVLVAGFLTLTVVQNASASWLSEITGVDVDLNRGKVAIKAPNINAVPQMLQNLPKDVSQAMVNPAAPLLASAIRFSRGQALNRGTQPIPPRVKSALSPYFPGAILESTRWTTASGLSIDGALKNWFNQEGAITYDDVVVFGGADLAQDVALWAHELTHVLQYRQMGVESFAFLYSVNWNQLEGQARRNSERIVASINATNQGQASTWGYSGEVAESSQQLSWNALSAEARRIHDPGKCIWVNPQMQATGNSCPVTVVVTGMWVQNIVNGAQYQLPCHGPTCVFPPLGAGPLLSPWGHQVLGVTAAYQP